MIRNIRINVQEGDKYKADDIPKKVLKWLENNKRYEEEERTDIIEGQAVVILEGKHMSMRGVLVKKLPKNLVLVSGLTSISGVAPVVMNQRYVLPVSTFFTLPNKLKEKISVNTEEIAKISAWTAENAVDMSADELVTMEGVQDELVSIIENECKKTKGMTTYFKTPFTLPKGIDALSAFY